MPVHKFKTGDKVFLEGSLNLPSGPCVIIRQLPERKSNRESHRRVVREGQLSAIEQNFPALCGLQPKCLILGIDHMPRQFLAFFDLSLEENFFVEHGCVRRGRLPRDGLTEVWVLYPAITP